MGKSGLRESHFKKKNTMHLTHAHANANKTNNEATMITQHQRHHGMSTSQSKPPINIACTITNTNVLALL